MSASPPRLTGHIIALAAAASILSATLTVNAQEVFDEGDNEPPGLRGGSFVFLPSITLRGGYTDNIDRVAGEGRAGSAIVIAPALSVRSDWTRHALYIDLDGRHSAYDGNFDELHGFFDATISGRLDIYTDSSLTLRAGNRISGRNGTTDHSVSAGADLSHRFNRLTMSLRGGVERFDFDDSRAGLSETVDTEVSDYTEYDAGLRLSYNVSSLTSLFVQGDVDRREHRQPVDINGFRRGSDGYAAAVGVRMSNGSKLSGELSAGYGVQKPDDPRLDDVDGVIVNGELEWQASALTLVSLDASTRFGETTLAGSGGYVRHGAGIEVEHLLYRKLALIAGLHYSRSDFVGVDLVEETLEAGLGLDYLLSKNTILTADAEHLRFESSQAGEDYTANTFTVGIKVRR